MNYLKTNWKLEQFIQLLIFSIFCIIHIFLCDQMIKICYISEIRYLSYQRLSQYKNRINHDDRRFFYTRGSLNLKQFIHPRGKYLIYNEKNAKN